MEGHLPLFNGQVQTLMMEGGEAQLGLLLGAVPFWCSYLLHVKKRHGLKRARGSSSSQPRSSTRLHSNGAVALRREGFAKV